MEREYAVIFLPTLCCDARCDYCFEDRKTGSIRSRDVAVFVDKCLDFMDSRDIDVLNLYWQGGEVFTLSPDFVAAVCSMVRERAAARHRMVRNHLQSNMLAYGGPWTPLIREHFGNSVGTSMDYPNRHRRMPGGTPEQYTRQWLAKVRQATDDGIGVGVIAVVHPETLATGARALYDFLTEQAGITSFQVNTPFPGGVSNQVKRRLPLDPGESGRFLVELTGIWLERGYQRGIEFGPSGELLEHFITGSARLPCFWQDNCANGYVCVSPDGTVSQCDCWAASYQEYEYGNLLGSRSLEELLAQGPARRPFLERPKWLVENEDCADCEFLAVCHGGCPIRAFSSNGLLFSKDPYCEAYRMLFAHIRRAAAVLAGQQRVG